MKKRTAKYSDDKEEIIGELHRVRDELPSIDELTGKSGRQTRSRLRWITMPSRSSNAKHAGGTPAINE